jgi:hypothetical protein
VARLYPQALGWTWAAWPRAVPPWLIVKVMLRPTVSGPVSLGIKHPFGTYDQTVLGLLMWGAISDERLVCHLPESQSAVVSLLSVCIIYILHVVKRMYICMYKYMYIQYIQGLCLTRLSVADLVLLLIAPATTAVYSLERSYIWPPPSLSLLYSTHSKKSHLLYDWRFTGNQFVLAPNPSRPKTRHLLSTELLR